VDGRFFVGMAVQSSCSVTAETQELGTIRLLNRRHRNAQRSMNAMISGVRLSSSVFI
jgi:hypothetical protein